MSDFLDLQCAKDLNTDAIHIGAVANSKDPVTGAAIDTHTNRAGGTDYTLHGFWNSIGPVVMTWTSVVGGTLTQPNQAFLHPANGNYYSWGGVYPVGGYVVAPGTDPTAVVGYVPRTDVVLRNEITTSVTEALRRSYAEAGFNLVDGSFEEGGTLTSASDVLLHKTTAEAYAWSGAFPKVVNAGSTPATSGGIGAGAWVDRTQDTLRSELILGALRTRNGAISLRDFASIKDYGVNGDGVTDVSSIFALAFSENDVVYVPTPEESYLITSITVPAGKSLITDGLSTIFKQLSGVPSGTRMIDVGGSNVTIGDCTCIGNISSDTDEQNHAIFIRADSTKGNIDNVHVGNIIGKSIRGDVVYVGQTVGYKLTNCHVGHIVYDDILRNALTVISGSGITCKSITGDKIGLHALNIEPNVGSGTATNIKIGYIKGRSVGVNSPTAADFIDGVTIDDLDLDPANSTTCSVVYTPGGTIQDALSLRNLKRMKIGNLKVNGFNRFAISPIYNAGELGCELLDIDTADIKNCSLTDVTYNSFIQWVALTSNVLKIDVLNTVITGPNKRFVDGMRAGSIGSVTATVTASGSLIRNCQDISIGEVFQGGANGFLLQACQRVSVGGGSFTGDRLATSSDKCTFSNFTAVAAAFLFSSGQEDHTILNSTLNGVYYPFGTAMQSYLHPMKLGNYSLWVNSAGKLYIKNGVPTSDTDGTIVGTQS